MILEFVGRVLLNVLKAMVWMALLMLRCVLGLAKLTLLVFLLSQKKSDSIVRLYVKIPSIPAASEVPVMNTEQHVQSANYSIQKAARDVLV